MTPWLNCQVFLRKSMSALVRILLKGPTQSNLCLFIPKSPELTLELGGDGGAHLREVPNWGGTFLFFPQTVVRYDHFFVIHVYVSDPHKSQKDPVSLERLCNITSLASLGLLHKQIMTTIHYDSQFTVLEWVGVKLYSWLNMTKSTHPLWSQYSFLKQREGHLFKGSSLF